MADGKNRTLEEKNSKADNSIVQPSRSVEEFEKLDQELLQDIARGIKDILEGKVKEV